MKEQFDNWAKVRDRINRQFVNKQLDDWSQEIIAKLHSEVFNHKYFTPCKNCPKTWISFHEQLEKWWLGNQHIYQEVASDEPEPVKKKRIMSEESKAKMRATIAKKKAEKLHDTKTV